MALDVALAPWGIPNENSLRNTPTVVGAPLAGAHCSGGHPQGGHEARLGETCNPPTPLVRGAAVAPGAIFMALDVALARPSAITIQMEGL